MKDAVNGDAVAECSIHSHRNKNFLRTMSSILSTLFCICSILMVLAAVVNRSSNGIAFGQYKMLTVLTGSMDPAIKAGSLIIVKAAEEGTIKAGDVITFKPSSERDTLLTHRVIQISDNGERYITQGDANDITDEQPVVYKDVIGRVVLSIPYLGIIFKNLSSAAGLISFIALIIFIYILGKVFTMIIKRKSGEET